MNDLILYTTEDGRSQIKLRAQEQTVWLSHLQVPGPGGARVSLHQDDGLEGATDPSPSGRSGAFAYLSVRVGLLRGVAHARGLTPELMFADCDQKSKLMRDPVAPAQRADAAMKKVLSRTLDDGTPAHSFQTLLQELQGIVRNTCRTPKSAADAPTFQPTTTPD